MTFSPFCHLHLGGKIHTKRKFQDTISNSKNSTARARGVRERKNCGKSSKLMLGWEIRRISFTHTCSFLLASSFTTYVDFFGNFLRSQIASFANIGHKTYLILGSNYNEGFLCCSFRPRCL